MLRTDEIFSAQTRRTVLKAAAISIVAYSVLVLLYANWVPYLGFQYLDRVIYRVEDTPAAGEAPTDGDRILAIAGAEIDSLPRYIHTLTNLRDNDQFPAQQAEEVTQLSHLGSPVAEIDGTRYVRVDFQRRAGATGSASAQAGWFQVREFPWQKSAVSVVWLAMESLIFWIAWLVFRRRPEDDSAALFFLKCIVTVGAHMGGYHWLRSAGSPALTFVFALCAMAVPQIGLHFYLLYPTPKRFLLLYPRATLLVLYGLPAILQVWILWTIGRIVSTFRLHLDVSSINWHVNKLEVLVEAYLALGAVMFACCVAALIHSYRSARLPIRRAQVSWLLAGAVVASVFVGYSFWLANWFPVEFALGDATWAMFCSSLVFTCAFAVSILRYQLLHVEEILQRGVMYLLFSFVGRLTFVGVLLLAIWFSPYLVSETAHFQIRLLSTFVVLVFLGLSAAASRIQKLLDRRFYRDKHQLDRAMKRMDEAVGRMVDRDAVLRRVLLVVRDRLQGREAAIYLRSADGSYRLGQELGHRGFPEVFQANHELVGSLSHGDLLRTNPGPMLPSDRTTALLRQLGVEIAQPFRLNEVLTGFLLLRPKSGGLFSPDDMEFLSGTADLATVALHTVQTRQTLERLNDELRDKVSRISQQQRQLLAIQSDVERGQGVTDNDSAPTIRSIHGSGTAVRKMVETVRKVAISQATVLIRGESGTGKGLLAEEIHRNSPRVNGPFVAVHCTALSPGLLESELFGHVKGAFTGAHRDKIGRFQKADGGTLFLDEIGDISLEVQTKLLRVLQEMTFEAVGSSDPIHVDVRVIAATHQPLERLAAQGRFRQDLFYRLNVISIVTPPLRERREDLFELAVHFLQKYASRSEKNLKGIEPEVIERLAQYDWPGNIRELENVIERAVVMTDGPTITTDDLPVELLGGGVPVAAPPPSIPSDTGNDRYSSNGHNPLTSELDSIEHDRLLDALASSGGNKSKAAKLLGIPRSTFCSKLKKFGIVY